MKKTLVKLTAFILTTCMCIGVIPTMADEANPESNPDEMLMLSEDVVELEEESATAAVLEEIVTEELAQDPSEEVVSTEELEITEPVIEETVPEVVEPVEETAPVAEEVVEEPSVIAEAPAEELVAEETVIIEETQTLAPETEAVVQKETAVIESATETTVEEVTTEKATAEETNFFADTVGDGYITVNPGEPVTMAVTVDASDTNIQYEWYVMGVDNEWQLIEGINGNTYTISNTIKVAGKYLCEVSDSHGNSQKLNFNVEVENHFSIEENAPIYALAGTNVTMSVGVRGDNLADMTYQWIVLGADEEEIIIEGANTAVYESAPITNQWATCYACKVQDCYGNMGYAFFDIILINDLQELSLDEVVSVTQTIPYSIIAYKYVPAVTGNYQIQLFESNIYCTICDENWNDLASNYQELSYDLQAGKTYYFKVQIGDEATGTVEAKLTMPEEHHMTSEVVSEATCIAEGEIKYTCKDDGCDYTYTDTIPVLPHELVKTEQKEATAEENGNIEYWTCCNCHKYFSDAEGKAEISLEDTITTVAAEPIEISSATVSGISNKTYNGNAQTQTFSISVNDAVLTEGTDYTVSYTNSVNAGTATVTITGIGQYIGTLTKTFTISAKTVTPTVTLAATTYTYDGTAKQPSVTVKDGSTTLAATDYTVAYSNNVNAGTSTATVTLKGNYSGSATASYSIQAKKITPTVTLSKRSFAYNGKEQKPAVTAVKDRTGTLPASVYDITYSGTCKKPGAYKVIVTLKGNYSGTATGNFSIVKAKNPMTVKTANKTVKVATVKKKAVTVKAITVTKAQGKVIYMKASGKFYFTVDKNTGKIKVKKRTPKGTYNVKVIVTAKGNYNYKRLSKTVYVKIVVK